MSRFFFWLFAAPLLLFLVIFATSNSQTVELTFWPLPFTITAPLYLFFLLILFVSFFFGALTMWFSQHKWRATTRRQKREIDKLQQQLAATPLVHVAPTMGTPIGTTVTATIADRDA